VRSIAIAVSALMFSAIAPVSAKTKTDHSTCGQRCHEYDCSGAASLMYCHYACRKKCQPEHRPR
jgi:hypothetical protein